MWAFWNVHLVIYPTHSRPTSDDRIVSWLTRLHSISSPLPSFRYTGLRPPNLALRNCLCSLWPSSQNCSWWESPHLEIPRRLINLGAQRLIWVYETMSPCLKVGNAGVRYTPQSCGSGWTLPGISPCSATSLPLVSSVPSPKISPQ